MSILAIFQLMTISPGFFLEGRKSFTNCKNLSFNRTNSPITPRFGSSIRSSDPKNPLNIYSYWHGWTGRYTGGAVRPKKGMILCILEPDYGIYVNF